MQIRCALGADLAMVVFSVGREDQRGLFKKEEVNSARKHSHCASLHASWKEMGLTASPADTDLPNANLAIHWTACAQSIIRWLQNPQKWKTSKHLSITTNIPPLLLHNWPQQFQEMSLQWVVHWAPLEILHSHQGLGKAPPSANHLH